MSSVRPSVAFYTTQKFQPNNAQDFIFLNPFSLSPDDSIIFFTTDNQIFSLYITQVIDVSDLSPPFLPFSAEPLYKLYLFQIPFFNFQRFFFSSFAALRLSIKNRWIDYARPDIRSNTL